MQTSLLNTPWSRTHEVFETVRTISRETPLLTSAALDELAGFQLFIKAESLQHTVEALQYGQVSAKDAQANAQADAASILERAAK